MRPKPDARRAQVKSAALHVFCEKGYAAATVSDISGRAGVAHGTFYLYYPSKKAAFLALLEDFAQKALSCFSALSTTPMPEEGATPDDLMALLRQGYAAFFALAAKNRRLTRLFFQEAVLAEPEITRRRAEVVSGFASQAEALLLRGMDLGLVAPLNARVAALCIVGMIERVTADFVSEGKKVSPDEPADELARFEVFGIAGKGASP